MIGGTKAITTLIVAAAFAASPTFPAYSEGLTTMGRSYAGPPAENHPKIDEKAYKSALDRIPAPDKKYDPWGIARPSESVTTVRKSN
jgi:hypothetical protein